MWSQLKKNRGSPSRTLCSRVRYTTTTEGREWGVEGGEGGGRVWNLTRNLDTLTWQMGETKHHVPAHVGIRCNSGLLPIILCITNAISELAGNMTLHILFSVTWAYSFLIWIEKGIGFLEIMGVSWVVSMQAPTARDLVQELPTAQEKIEEENLRKKEEEENNARAQALCGAWFRGTLITTHCSIPRVLESKSTEVRVLLPSSEWGTWAPKTLPIL